MITKERETTPIHNFFFFFPEMWQEEGNIAEATEETSDKDLEAKMWEYERNSWEGKDYVFLSYRSTDSIEACKIKSVLEKNNIRCFRAPESIPLGGNYAEVIPKAIEKCKAVVLVLSKEAQNSLWIPKEIEMALERRIPVIPFKIEDCELSMMFKFLIGDSQSIDAYKDRKGAMQTLLHTLRQIL